MSISSNTTCNIPASSFLNAGIQLHQNNILHAQTTYMRTQGLETIMSLLDIVSESTSPIHKTPSLVSLTDISESQLTTAVINPFELSYEYVTKHVSQHINNHNNVHNILTNAAVKLQTISDYKINNYTNYGNTNYSYTNYGNYNNYKKKIPSEPTDMSLTCICTPKTILFNQYFN